MNLRSVEDLGSLDWKDFEVFATETLRRYYARYSVELVPTEFSHDGGRDGEATYILGSDDNEPSLAIFYRIWLEVKKRSVQTVTLDDIGKNLVLASNDTVHKLVVVTNGGYAPQVHEAIEKFACRHHLSYSLISGEQLLQLAREVVGDSTEVPHATSTAIAVHVHLSLSRDPYPFDARQGSTLTIHEDEPVFLVATVERPTGGVARNFSISVDASADGVEITPYASTATLRLAGGDHGQVVFAVSMQRATVDASVFAVHVQAEPETSIDLRVSWHTTFRAARTLLTRHIPTSRAARLTHWVESFRRWLNHEGRFACAFVAYAGVGKSMMLNRLRSIWLRESIREIYIHGGRHPRDADIATTIFEAAFPIDRSLLDSRMVSAVERWLSLCRISKSQSHKLAVAFCNDGFLPDTLSSAALADLCVSLLGHIGSRGKVVLVVDDLHFCTPSAIDLLRRMHLSLRDVGSDDIAFVCTTRPYAAAADDEAVQIEWARRLADFFNTSGIQPEKLEAPNADEAADLLQRTIPTLEVHHARIIVEQVGRTPLALREAVAWFATKEIIRRDPVLEEFVADPDLLRTAVASDELKDATASRLRALRARYPMWLSDVLDGAACIGRFFELNAVLPANWQWDKAQTEAIARCSELDVFRPFNGETYTFDHDLIRSAVVALMDPSRQQRIATSLVEKPAFRTRPEIRGVLEYQAGRFKDAAGTLRSAGEAAIERHRFGDALQALQLALTCIDPPLVERVESIPADIATQHAPRPIATAGSPTSENTRREVLATLRLLLKCAESTSAYTSHAAGTFLTEAMMIARSLDDRSTLAELLTIEGMRAFERDDVEASIHAHEQAERLFQAENDTLARANNLLRLSIAQRQSRQRRLAPATLHRAHSIARGRDPDLLVRLTLNAGANHLATDLRTTARYWRSALRLATRAGLTDRRVHAMIDVGYLDLLLGDDERAAEHLATGLELALEYELENSALRAASNLACLHLVRDDVTRALELLRFAETIGLQLEIGRRLWRVRGNLATAYEAYGDLARAYTIDTQLVATLTAAARVVSTATRRALPLLNLARRAADHPQFSLLWKQVPRGIRYATKILLKSLDTAVAARKMPLVVASQRTIAGQQRFIITE